MKRLLLLLLCFIGEARGQHIMPPVMLDIPVTEARIRLGHRLFFETRVSDDNTVSCATCHNPETGWADHNVVAVGVRGLTQVNNPRNSPTIINAVFAPLQFHDSRTVGIVTQALQPIVNAVEMGTQTEQQVLDRLRSDATYVRDFVEAYGPRNPTAITGRRFGHAIASFESTVISFDAPMDRRQQGNLVLSPMAEIGYGLFIKSHCMQCHVPPLFTDLRPHNNGMEFATKFFADDVGRIAITPDEPDSVRAFKTATLRQIADTYPYSHAGSLPTLAAVVRHYNSGGQRFDGTFDPFMDKRIKPLGLTDYQVKCLVTFLMEGFTAFDYPRFKPPRNLR